MYGESVINDAMAIVLYRSFLTFFYVPVSTASVGACFGTFFALAAGSLVLGLGVTIVASLTLKHLPFSGMPNLEALVVVLFSYAAFAGKIASSARSP